MISCHITDEDFFGKKRSGIVPTTSGEEKCAPNHAWGPGVRPHYLIHYVVSGKGVLYCGPNKFNLRKGQVFVVFPGTVMKYQADEHDPWHYAWITFYGDEVKEIFSQIGVSLSNPVLSVQNGAEVLEVIRNMPSERSADVLSNVRFSVRIYEFMSLLLENQKLQENSENVYLTAARRYIKAHYYEEITVEQVAAHIGISRKYLFAIFKKLLNLSPQDYLIDYRMKRAAEFLKDNTLSVGHVAYSVGYKDPLTFSKMFKRRMGVSPSTYRQSV